MLMSVILLERWHSHRPLSRETGVLNTDEISSIKQGYEDGVNMCHVTMKNGEKIMVAGRADCFVEAVFAASGS